MDEVEQIVNELEATDPAVKAKVYDHIIQHLKQAQNDPRPREKVRAQIALANIKKWTDSYANQK